MTTRVTRHASKKATTSNNINSKLCFFGNYIESDFDQTVNYSLLYSEENSVVEEVGFFDYLVGSSEQENTLTTYYTEGTPNFETPLYFSTSTSTSDLLKLDDSKVINTIQEESKEYFTSSQVSSITKDELEKPKERYQPKSFMEFKDKEKECENTDTEIYLPDDAEDSDDKCDEERLERIINVTPSQSPDLCDKEGKMVTFGGEDCYTQQTPLMFSRCSSLGSLSGYEQQSLQDDHSSIVSDFSLRTSEVVSPSELPDSPAQLVGPSTVQKDKKLVRRKMQQGRGDKAQSFESSTPQQETTKHSIFEDDLAVFKEESTPIRFQSVAASSLSSLTIDDDDDIDERDRGEVKNKAGVIRTLKTDAASCQFDSHDESEKKKGANHGEKFEENSYSFVDEEKILDEYIRKGIAKVTRQHVNDVSSFNLQANSTYDSGVSDPEKSCESACNTTDSQDFFENSDLTDEEEKLLDECIRRGIAKVTRQDINDVTSISLRSSFSQLSMRNKRDNNDK